MSTSQVLPELPALPNLSGDPDAIASVRGSLAPSMQTPQPIQELVFRLQGDLVVAHRVASRLREDRDRAWAEARQLRAEAAHLEQQWRHDFMEVQNELNKEKRSRIELEKILEETISSASHLEADLTACKLRERVMQRQLARASATWTQTSLGTSAPRRHGSRSRAYSYELSSSSSSSSGARPPRPLTVNESSIDEPSIASWKGSSRMQGSQSDSISANISADSADRSLLPAAERPVTDEEGKNTRGKVSPYNKIEGGTDRDHVGPEEGGEGAREIATHPTLSTEADMVEMLEQLEFMNQRLASLHSDNLGLRKLLETVKNERDNLFEKLAVSVPPVDMISKVESSIDTKANQELLIDHSQNVLELEKLRAELAKKSEEIQSLTAKLRSFESGRGNLTANVSKDHYIDDELVQGSLPHKAHQHDAYSRSHGGEGDGAFIQAASDGEEGVVEFGDIMRSRLQTELEVTRDALRTEKLLAQKNIAKMQEVIASLKAQLRDGEEETELLRLQLLVQQLRCEVDGAESRGLERLRRAQATVREQAETIDILTRALQQHRSMINPS